MLSSLRSVFALKSLPSLTLVFCVSLLVACKDTNASDSAVDESAAADQAVESAEAQVSPVSDEAAAILERLSKARPDLKFTSVVPAGAEGLYEVTFEGGSPVYAFPSGEHFFVGELYKIEEDDLVNLTEQKRDGERRGLMADVLDKDMIIFEPKGEVKAEVFVFTDVDCGYCRMIHREVPAMNEMGIRVKYLAYPRAGIGSQSYNKIASAWCSRDRHGALSALKEQKNIPQNVCNGNPVSEHLALGQQVGVRGTPAIVLESGELVPGALKSSVFKRPIKLS